MRAGPACQSLLLLRTHAATRAVVGDLSDHRHGQATLERRSAGRLHLARRAPYTRTHTHTNSLFPGAGHHTTTRPRRPCRRVQRGGPQRAGQGAGRRGSPRPAPGAHPQQARGGQGVCSRRACVAVCLSAACPVRRTLDLRAWAQAGCGPCALRPIPRMGCRWPCRNWGGPDSRAMVSRSSAGTPVPFQSLPAYKGTWEC